MRRSKCENCCLSPIAPVVLQTACLLIALVISSFILGNGFTVNPSPQEVLVGSLVAGIIVVSCVGFVVGLVYAILICWRNRRDKRQLHALEETGAIKIYDTQDEEDDNEHFRDILSQKTGLEVDDNEL